MSDFLHKLRNGNDYRNGNETRFNKKRRQYDTGQGVVYDRRVPNESRKKNQPKPFQQDQVPAQSSEVLLVIRDLLQEISDKQERLAMAEERKASALEAIAEQLQSEKGVSLNVTGEVAGGHKVMMREKRKKRAKKFEDPNRKRVMQIIESMRKDNETYQDIADKLEKEELKTFSGRGKWHAQTVHRLCQD
ncbi:MAG: hypothetical protein ABIK15_20660 [Pseudomonadota bacterium]